jgi:hypothetical protein
MASVFKTSSIDHGYHPDFEILLESGALFDQAFADFARRIREGTAEAGLMQELAAIVASNRSESAGYLWDPYGNITREIRSLHWAITARAVPPAGGSSPAPKAVTSSIWTPRARVRSGWRRAGSSCGRGL